MLRRALLLSFLALSVTFAAPGCSTLSHWTDPGPEELGRSVEAFTKFMRWKQFAKAKLFVAPGRERAFLKFTQSIETTLDISDFSVEDVSIDESDAKAGLRTEGRAQVRISYTRLPSNVYSTRLIEQTWVVKDGQWMLDFPDGGWDL